MNIRYMGFLLLFFQQLVIASSTEIVAQQSKQISSALAQTVQAQVAKLNSKQDVVKSQLIVRDALKRNVDRNAILQQDANKIKASESEFVKKQTSLACDGKLLDTTITCYKADPATYAYSQKYDVPQSVRDVLTNIVSSKNDLQYARNHEEIKSRQQKVVASEGLVENAAQQDLQQKQQAVADQLAKLKLNLDANVQQQAKIADNCTQLNFLDSLLAEKREQINTDKWQKLVGKKVAQRQDATRYAVKNVEDLINGVYKQEEDRLTQAAQAQQEAERLQAQAELTKKQDDAAVTIEVATRGFFARRQLPLLRKEHAERIAQQKIVEELSLAKAKADKEKAERDRLVAEQIAESARREQEFVSMQAEEKYEKNRLLKIEQEDKEIKVQRATVIKELKLEQEQKRAAVNKKEKRLAKAQADLVAFQRKQQAIEDKKQADIEAVARRVELQNKKIVDEQAKKEREAKLKEEAAARKVELENKRLVDEQALVDKKKLAQDNNHKFVDSTLQATKNEPKRIIIKRPELLITGDETEESLKQAAIQRRQYFEKLQEQDLDASAIIELMQSEDDRNNVYDNARLSVYQLQDFLQPGLFYNAPYGEYMCSNLIKIHEALGKEGGSLGTYFKNKDLVLATLAAQLIAIEDATRGKSSEVETSQWAKLNEFFDKNQRELKILIALGNQKVIDQKLDFVHKLQNKLREKVLVINDFLAFHQLRNIQRVITPQSQAVMDDKMPSLADTQRSVSPPLGTVGFLTPEDLETRRIKANNYVDDILRKNGRIKSSDLVPLVAKFIEDIDFNNEKIEALASTISNTIMQEVVILDGQALTEEKKQMMFESIIEGTQAAKPEDLAILADIAKMHGMLVEILFDRQQAAKK